MSTIKLIMEAVKETNAGGKSWSYLLKTFVTIAFALGCWWFYSHKIKDKSIENTYNYNYYYR